MISPNPIAYLFRVWRKNGIAAKQPENAGASVFGSKPLVSQINVFFSRYCRRMGSAAQSAQLSFLPGSPVTLSLGVSKVGIYARILIQIRHFSVWPDFLLTRWNAARGKASWYSALLEHF